MSNSSVLSLNNLKNLGFIATLFTVIMWLAGCGGGGFYNGATSTGTGSTVAAQTATVTVIIRDTTGFAVPTATVKIGTSSQPTNEQGIATFSLASGQTYSATVTANGYQTTTADVVVGAGLTTATQTIRVPTTASATASTVTARIFNGATGALLANTQIQVSGVTMTTGANGDVTLSTITTSGRVIFNVNSEGFAQQSIVQDVVVGRPSNINIQLLPLQLAGSINPTTGGSVSLSNPATQVTVTANCLTRTDSQPIVGNASIYITPINSILNIHQLPGELATVGSDGQRQLIESFGAIVINAYDVAGANLSLSSGCVATVSIPVVTRSSALPATTPLYVYDVSKGYWVVDGSNVLTLSADKTHYTGNTSQFGAVSAASPYQSVNVTGCLADTNGYSLQNVPVSLEGVDYSGFSTAVTNSDGTFTIAARANSTVIVSGQLGRSSSNSNKVTVSSSTYNMTPCLVMTNLTNGVTVKLTWGALPFDLDSHLFAPDGSFVYYASRGSLTSAPYANLDIDDTTSFGPEIVTIRRLMVGDYYYVVNNYSQTHNPGITGSPARVELNTPTGSQLFVPSAGETVGGVTNNYWHVFTLRVDASCNISVISVGNWLSNESTLQRSSQTPVYCVPPSQ